MGHAGNSTGRAEISPVRKVVDKTPLFTKPMTTDKIPKSLGPGTTSPLSRSLLLTTVKIKGSASRFVIDVRR